MMFSAPEMPCRFPEYDSDMMSGSLLPEQEPSRRPERAVSSLIAAVAQHHDDVPLLQVDEGEEFVVDGRHIWLIESDSLIAVYAGMHQRMLMAGRTPWVLGLGGVFDMPADTVIVRALTPLSARKVDAALFRRLITEEGLWRSVVEMFCFSLHISLARQSVLGGKNDYTIIRALLLEFSQLPPVAHQKIPVAHYIMARSAISRSNTMKILSMLKRRNHIALRRGMLTALSELPPELW